MDETTFSFEQLAQQNGSTFWRGRDFMIALGYDSWDLFKALVRKTMALALQASWVEAEKEFRYVEHEDIEDYKLSRWACYMLAIHADPSYPKVQEAQLFFVNTVEAFQARLSPEDIERFGIRGQLKDSFKDLHSTFSQHKGTDYVRFNQAGIIGMYNQENWKLAKARGVESNKIYENMNRTELAANLFRVTQTEEKIKHQGIQGQANLEQAHQEVGKAVRAMVKENVGKFPEQLEQAERPVSKIESNLKKTHKRFGKMDN